MSSYMQGSISTEEVLPDERVIDMRQDIVDTAPDQTQFTTLTQRARTETAIREKVNWLEQDLFPRIVTASAVLATGGTALVLQPGNGALLQGNDLLRNMRTGEGLRVVSLATDTATVERAVGSAVEAAINVGDKFLVVTDAQPQGSDFPKGRYARRVLGYNFTGIARTTWEFTGTATSIELYGGREPSKEAARKTIEHKRKLEASGFFGMREYYPAAANGEPMGVAGGAIEFIQTNKLNANGPLTPDGFDLFMADVLSEGTTDKVIYTGPAGALNFSRWNRQGMGSAWAPGEGSVHGVKVDAFISGAYGYRIPVITKKEWAEFGPGGYAGYLFVLDHAYIAYKPLRDRDTKMLTEQQPKGKDVYAAEYMTEWTWMFANEKAHGLITGITTVWV